MLRKNGLCNIVFGSVVKPIVLATLIFEMSTVRCVSSCLFYIVVKCVVVATCFFENVVKTLGMTTLVWVMC